jgi:two-component system NtrC family sensor kinase
VAAVDSILRSVGRCKKITHRLLGFARHMEIQNESIDLEVLLREVLDFLEKEAEYRDLTVDFEVDPDLPTIVSDRGQLQQVFLNILNNAFAAVSDGGQIGIKIALESSDRVAVTVSDDGIGIAQEHLERIFEPFFTTKKTSGTGLGLSITYGIVKKLGGEIRVQSEVGEGTSFTVSLPVSREA